MIAASAYDQGATLRAQVQQQRGAYDHIVIDCGGRDNSALRAALTVADIALIPFLPRSYDIWAFEDIAALLDETRAVHDIRALAFLNLADPHGADNEGAAQAVAGYPQLELAPFRINRRKAIAHASGAGLHISEYRPRDPQACEEVAQMQRYLMAI
jgi:chromosome partitioning protein